MDLMNYAIGIVAVYVVFSFLGITSVSARDAVVSINATGGAYEGPPNLRLLADGRLIGERSIGRPIDTAAGKKLTKANRKLHAEWYTFKVPALNDVTKLEIEFNNEAWEGKGKPGKRNLFVFSVVIDGYRFRPSFLRASPTNSGGAWRSQAMLWQNGRLQLYRPPKGWWSGYKAATPSE
jgi:hypothetical protein